MVYRRPYKTDDHIYADNHRQWVHHQGVIKIKMEKIFQSANSAAAGAWIARNIMKHTDCKMSVGIFVGCIAQNKIRHQHQYPEQARPIPPLICPSVSHCFVIIRNGLQKSPQPQIRAQESRIFSTTALSSHLQQPHLQRLDFPNALF